MRHSFEGRLGRRLRIVGLLSLSIICTGSFAQAEPWQTKDFLNSLEDRDAYNADFWSLGLHSVFSIEFEEGYTAQYRPFLNYIQLSESMGDRALRLKGFDELSHIQLGTLAHESFHSFVQNYIKTSDEYSFHKEWMSSRSRVLHGEELSKHKAYVALEEGYALFIGSLITQRRNIEKMIKRRQERIGEGHCEDSIDLADQFWFRVWEDDVFGYYYEDGVGEYWINTGKSIWNSISGSDLEVKDGPIFVDRSITEVDKDWIADYLFEGRMPRDVLEAFSDSLREANCL